VAVRLFTPGASALLAAIRAAIDEGHIDTWSYDSDGDFTHTTHDRQWENRAWLKPRILKDRLLLNIVFASNATQKRQVYAVYHGRFIEMAVTHFPAKFTEGVATANMTKEDQGLNPQ
jgi:hypothetical protein